MDLEALQAELADLNSRRRELREKFANQGPRGRGGAGRGGPGRAPAAGRGLDRAGFGRQSSENGSLHDDARRSSVLDRLGRPGDHRGSGAGSSREASRPWASSSHVGDHRSHGGSIAEDDRARRDQPPSRKRLLSAVVVDGETRTATAAPAAAEPDEPGEAPDEHLPPAKRQAVAPDEKTQRRNRRMFGSLLLGTLHKFKAEESQFRQSEAAQKRQELERRAEEKEQQTAVELRERARQQRQAEEEAEREQLRTVNVQANQKLAEIRCAKRIAHMTRVSNWLVTQTEPPLRWTPGKASPATDKAAAAQAKEFEAWKQQQLEALEQEKEQIAAKSEAARGAAAQRRQQRRGVVHVVGAAGQQEDAAMDAGDEEGEQEDAQQQQQQDSGDGGDASDDDGKQQKSGQQQQHRSSDQGRYEPEDGMDEGDDEQQDRQLSGSEDEHRSGRHESDSEGVSV